MWAEIYMWQMEQELRDLLQISRIASTGRGRPKEMDASVTHL